jgi:alpha-glucoside transport system permease protein
MTTPAVLVEEDLEKQRKKQKGAKESRDASSGAGLFTYAALAIIVFLWVVPTIGILLTSFRTEDQQDQGGWWNLFLHPSTIADLTIENYKDAIQGTNLGEGFINSLAIALPATFIPILIAAFAAYAFTFMKFWGRDILFIIIVSMLVVPNFVSFVPMLRLYRDYTPFGGEFPAVWLFHVGFGMSLAIYMLRNYMSTLPGTIIE